MFIKIERSIADRLANCDVREKRFQSTAGSAIRRSHPTNLETERLTNN